MRSQYYSKAPAKLPMSLSSLPVKLSLSTSLEQEVVSAQRAQKREREHAASAGGGETSCNRDRGEVPYYENIPRTAYKLVFAPFSVNELKELRLVCRKWHREIFPLLEERSAFTFRGSEDPADSVGARSLSNFLNVVPKDSFQWKMLRVLYPRPEEALPVPVLIQWSHLRILRANWLELRQWMSRTHLPNISTLHLHNCKVNWSKYLLIFRECEGLSVFHDTCVGVDLGLWEEFEKGCAFNERVSATSAFHSIYPAHTHIPINPNLTFHSKRLKEVRVRRSRLEELTLFLKLLLAMECSSIETLFISAEDVFRGAGKSKKKGVRLSEPKNVLFAHIGALFSKNRLALREVKISFRPPSPESTFSEQTKAFFEDGDCFLYKPDLRDLLLFMKAHRWSKLGLTALTSLEMEVENRKIPTVDEVEYFTNFLNSLTNLRTLRISHCLLTAYNALSIPLFIKRLQPLRDSGCKISLGITLRPNDAEGLAQSSRDKELLPSNLALFYPHLTSIICTVPTHDMQIASSLFPWGRGQEVKQTNTSDEEKIPHENDQQTVGAGSPENMEASEKPLMAGCEEKSITDNDNGNPADCENEKLSQHENLATQTPDTPENLTATPEAPTSAPSVQDFWLIDERPRTLRATPLFHMLDLVQSYPNLVTLILRDCGSGLSSSAPDLSRWPLLDDYGMQLVLQGLPRLQHLNITGNLFFLTDVGMTGLSPQSILQMEGEKVAGAGMGQGQGFSFADLKELEYCNLEYVGPRFTDLSLRHGFFPSSEEGFPSPPRSLKYLRISGLLQITPSTLTSFKKQFPPKSQVVISSQKV